MPVDRWNRAQLVGATQHYLLDVTFAGRTWRFAQSELQVSDATAGITYAYQDVLVGSVTYRQAWDFLSQSPEPNTASFEIAWPESVAALIAAGHDLGAATAEFSKWIEGTDYDARRVLLRGRVVEPEWGGDGETVRLSVEEAIYNETATIPTSTMRLDYATINIEDSGLSESDFGQYYPVIIGRPGWSSTLGDASGSQAIWRSKNAEFHSVILAGHHVACEIVKLVNDDLTAGQHFSVRNTADARGQEVAIVLGGQSAAIVGPTVTYYPSLDVDCDASFSAATADSDVPIFVVWDDAEREAAGTTWGGVSRNGTIVRGAGDVIAYVMSFSDLEVNFSRLDAVAPLINSYLIDATIDAPTHPLEWVQANLSAILPITLAVGGNGFYYMAWNPSATKRDAVGHVNVDIDPQIEVAEHVAIDNTQVKNSFSLDFAYSTRTDAYSETAHIGQEDAFYSKCVLRSLETTKAQWELTIISRASGEPGEGIAVAIVVGAPGVAENIAAKTVTITVDVGGVQVDAVRDNINRLLTTVRAELTAQDENENFAAADAQTEVTAKFGAMTASYACTISQARYGVRHETIQSLCIYDEATAYAVLDWMAAAYCFPQMRLEMVVPEAEWDWLSLADVVLFSDARLHMSERLGWVSAIEHGDDGMLGLEILFIEQLARDARPAP